MSTGLGIREGRKEEKRKINPRHNFSVTYSLPFHITWQMNQIESSRLQASRGRGGRILHLWHIGQPLQDGTNTLEVIWHSDMRDAIVMHDLHTSQLVVGRVNVSAQDLL